jgi:pilus assembly protein Flp/PilA
MQDLALKFYVRLWLLKQEEGQDLIEYALVVSLIAFAAIAGMNSLASGINNAFSNIAAELATSA